MAARVLFLVFATVLGAPTNAQTDDRDLVGLWQAYKSFGPLVSGPLLIDHELTYAEIAGLKVPVRKSGQSIEFHLPSDQGSFRGRVNDNLIKGHWTQPAPLQVGQKMDSPVLLRKLNDKWWQGHVHPKTSEYTFFLPVTASANGLTAYLRNPDRNLGLFTRIKRIARESQKLSFLGSWGWSREQQELAHGSYNPESDTLTMTLSPWRGGTYEFSRYTPGTHSSFYARPDSESDWPYTPPPLLNDGWQVSSLQDARIDFEPLREMIEEYIETLDDDLHTQRIHGVLIAREGKLVLEEYFHSFSRNKTHDTRSASKSVVSVLVGAAMQAGYAISANTPVYDTLLGPDPDREPRKQAMVLGDLLTMSSGFYCDDNDSDAPGNEGRLQDQTDEPDWYKYTLALPMAHEPGEVGIYCSVNSNLIGAVLSKVTGKSLQELVLELAENLQINHYYLGLQPTGEVYFGGGAQWLPRDFMKIGQLMLNSGRWQNKQIVDQNWVIASTSQQIQIGDRDYGYQWWVNHYPYKDGTISAFFAAGNGGQIVMGVPALDLVIAFYGGSYSDGVFFRTQNELIPNFILRAVKN